MQKMTAVRADHLTKQYRLGTMNHNMLRQDLSSWWHRLRGVRQAPAIVDEAAPETVAINGSKPAGEPELFKALDDVSFVVNAGDALGIVGGNGAGKSTLLKLVARVTLPTSGRLMIDGRILSMLEVGTGFSPELSGRDNVYLNGMLIGMTKAEVRSKFDEIVEFAEVPRFIDTPVKRYSSGMQVRLAFSVAAHFTPEILIIDEVLAVGDARFQQRCLEKMHGVLRAGRTILLVSHDMSKVSSICNKGMYLRNGRSEYLGPTAEAVSLYEQATNAGQFTPGASFDQSMLERRVGNDYARLVAAAVLSSDSKISDEVDIADPVTLRVVFDISESRNTIPVPNFLVFRVDKTCAFAAAPPAMGSRTPGRYCAECRIPGHFLNDGIYYVGIELMSHADAESTLHFSENRLLTFRVVEDEDDPTRFRYSQKAIIPGGVRPTELFEWRVEQM
jgi:lipopolysaccharide transport system ATP-binding protein